ncbi:MarR family transcriptional regulator [Streptomyces sp. NPDC005385]|uniref:MarR family winged helix-turn-helix transcriptional regulator n=1 Tax=Streptomyces sp. NPDC005385 TaxID=3157039 RepID=UPI0033BEE29C
MTERSRPASEPIAAAAVQVQGVAELLDVLWEQSRAQSAPPYVHASQLRVMGLLDRDGGLRMRELTELLGASPPSVTRLIDRLQALGFVTRGVCPDSRREVMLSITLAGRSHLAKVRESRSGPLLEALAAMPRRERTALTSSLENLQRRLLNQPALILMQPDDPADPGQRATA